MSSHPHEWSSADRLDYRILIIPVPPLVRHCASFSVVGTGRIDVSSKDNYATYPVIIAYRFRRLVIGDRILRDRRCWTLVGVKGTWCEGWSWDLERVSALLAGTKSLLTRQVLPLFFPVTYRFILPPFSSLGSTSSYQALASDPDDGMVSNDISSPAPGPAGKAVYLTTGEKLALMRPLVLRYMLPLCAVYIEEYIINSVGL